ncbi:helicase related [Anaeramoeba flamelloides]|uniref:Helicase related n=1 Tax=Anaeramoeba flamelloides TaxID=1746091 RepID=A0AAV8A2E7_9EUKA|nr:helicase related [Anaeramoeba flamelloides]
MFITVGIVIPTNLSNNNDLQSNSNNYEEISNLRKNQKNKINFDYNINNNNENNNENNNINNNININNENNNNKNNYMGTKFQQTKKNEENDDLIWFLQVSDTHLSQFAKKRVQVFDRFLKEIVPSVGPSFVLHTGDITDSLKKISTDIYQNDPNEKEWEQYKETLERNGLYRPDLWLDIRGNHDGSNVLDRYSPNNLFYKYSVQGPIQSMNDRKPVNKFTIKKNGKEILDLISLDFCQYPKASFPLGFFGTDSEELVDQLEEELERLNNQSRPLLYFSHYSIAFVTDLSKTSKTGKSLRNLIEKSNSYAYLSGHIHDHYMTNFLFTNSKPILDMEIADLAWRQSYRIMALDNGIFSFVDKTLKDQWPLILILNPKDSRYISLNEEWQNIKKSKEIRVLIFEKSANWKHDPKKDISVNFSNLPKFELNSNNFNSNNNKEINITNFLCKDSKIVKVIGKIDNNENQVFELKRKQLKNSNKNRNYDNGHGGAETVNVDENTLSDYDCSSPLWVTNWDTNQIPNGVHEIEIIVITKDGNRTVQRQQFSVDGTQSFIGLSIFQLIQRQSIVYITLFNNTVFFVVLIIGLLIFPQVLKWYLKRNNLYQNVIQRLSIDLSNDPNNNSIILNNHISKINNQIQKKRVEANDKQRTKGRATCIKNRKNKNNQNKNKNDQNKNKNAMNRKNKKTNCNSNIQIKNSNSFESPVIKLIWLHIRYALWLYSNIPKGAWIILLYTGFSVMILPFNVSPIIGEKWGVNMIWGSFVNSKKTFYSFHQLFFKIYLGLIHFPTSNFVAKMSVSKKNCLRYPTTYFSFISILSCIVFFVYTFHMGYNLIGNLSSLGLVWNSVFLFLLFLKTAYNSFKNSKKDSNLLEKKYK